jgi:hypothetical protein
VIRVRYQDTSYGSHHGTGLYGTAKSCPQGVTIYLVPGLTGRQRKAVIRRLRQEASRGCGPELPLPQLVIALFLDRVRGAIGLALAAVRFHPGVTLLPAAFVAAVMTLFVLASAGVGPADVARPVLAAAQSGAGLGSAAGADGRADTGADGLVTIDGGSEGAPAGGAGAGGIRPSSIGAGGRGLGSAQPAPATGPRSTGRPRAAQVCFGAMAGVAQQRSQLACHRASS